MARVWLLVAFVTLSLLAGAAQDSHAQDWQRVPTPTGSNGFITPYFLNSEVGFTFVAGVMELNGYPEVPAGTTGLARTTDGGATWTSIAFFDSLGCSISQLCFVSLTHGYASTVSLFNSGTAPAGIYETTDEGLHWNKITAGSNWFEGVYASRGSIFAVEISSGSRGTLGTQLIYSRNDGASWDSVPRPGTDVYDQPPYVGGFQWAYGNRDSLVATAYLYPTGNSYLVYSSNLGTTWDSVLLDQNYPWNMVALYIAPHSCCIFREFLDNFDLNNDTYSFLQAEPPYISWSFSIEHLETGAWMTGNACAAYLSYAGQDYSHGPIQRTTDGGVTWSSVGTSHTDGRVPNINEIDDNDWQNLSVVGYGAVIYAIGTDYTSLWKTTDGGDDALSESALAPRITFERSPFFSGNDTLLSNLCATSTIAISIQKLSCAFTKISSFSIAGVSTTEFTDSLATHNDCLALPDTIFLTISPSSYGIRTVTVSAKFVDDEFNELNTSLSFVLDVSPGTTVPLRIHLSPESISTQPGDTISIPVYLSGNAMLGATTISMPFELDTNALVPIGFQALVPGIAAGTPVYRNGALSVTLQSAALDLHGDTLLGMLRCVAYVGDTLSTTVWLAAANVSSQVAPCIALSLEVDSVDIHIVGCGTPMVEQLMRSGHFSLAIRSISPNPAEEWVKVDFDNSTSSTISYQVLDALGTVRAEGEALGNSLMLDTHALPAGLYYVRASTATGAVASGKFVVEH